MAPDFFKSPRRSQISYSSTTAGTSAAHRPHITRALQQQRLPPHLRRLLQTSAFRPRLWRSASRRAHSKDMRFCRRSLTDVPALQSLIVRCSRALGVYRPDWHIRRERERERERGNEKGMGEGEKASARERERERERECVCVVWLRAW